ncbi:DUF5667 domain-containing protein [Streptomyces sp. RFCAC02]|uniref:DUF5667 domain-containing protein n=1 Tax=Streptomyces sp. RFCAC02 TaxID=2499143 RepID=UPI0019D1A872|nr:DUF5667 domain-containing protein [Streptomyces sp. RFCAC02]
MIGSVSANRRANAFAHLLDQPRLGEPRSGESAAAADHPAHHQADHPVDHPADSTEHAALLSVADRLSALPRPELPAAAKEAQRAALIAAMQAAYGERTAPAEAAPGAGVPAPRRAPGGRGLHRAVGAGALARLRPRTRLTKGLAAGGLTMGVAAGAFGGVAAASSDALPGDTLYGLKRSMEDLRLDFTDGDIDRGRVYLDHASTRLNEARRLLERGRSGPLDEDDLAAIHRALTALRDDAAEAHRLLAQAYEADGSLDPIQSLSAFTENHRATWTEIRHRIPPELRGVAGEVTDVLDAMDDDIAPLKSLLPDEPANASAAAGSATAPDRGARPAESHDPAPPSSPTPSDEGGAASPADGGSPPADEGLLGGVGILEPGPATDSGTPTDSPSPGATEQDAEGALPEITIPPLVDDLLPGLGLDTRGDGAD